MRELWEGPSVWISYQGIVLVIGQFSTFVRCTFGRYFSRQSLCSPKQRAADGSTISPEHMSWMTITIRTLYTYPNVARVPFHFPFDSPLSGEANALSGILGVKSASD